MVTQAKDHETYIQLIYAWKAYIKNEIERKTLYKHLSLMSKFSNDFEHWYNNIAYVRAKHFRNSAVFPSMKWQLAFSSDPTVIITSNMIYTNIKFNALSKLSSSWYILINYKTYNFELYI